MKYQDLFKDGSLSFVRDFVSKIVYQGLNAPLSSITEAIVIGISALIVLFVLYKLLWLVWESMKFVISCLEW
ncbi:MAG: hypothetical protein I3273_02640 [Candidatus Moeniiplasma glomeromycotorum]|nr:hypothetical protein [Candidatus Moeniiplasma glomeromycotorum]MCE8167646.1 hypothetical protein [Candidatus Moeniiplasma glomeromycotorum]MCE8169003.1 hypothetical protein [Candidatus Moeniiplasma glomeromycotorum]